MSMYVRVGTQAAMRMYLTVLAINIAPAFYGIVNIVIQNNSIIISQDASVGNDNTACSANHLSVGVVALACSNSFKHTRSTAQG